MDKVIEKGKLVKMILYNKRELERVIALFGDSVNLYGIKYILTVNAVLTESLLEALGEEIEEEEEEDWND